MLKRLLTIGMAGNLAMFCGTWTMNCTRFPPCSVKSSLGLFSQEALALHFFNERRGGRPFIRPFSYLARSVGNFFGRQGQDLRQNDVEVLERNFPPLLRRRGYTPVKEFFSGGSTS